MLELKINHDFHGPSIVELEPVLGDIQDDMVEVLWSHTPREIAVLRGHPEKSFTLFVRDIQMMERAAEQLGLPVKFDLNTLETGKLALISRIQKWDEFSKGVGASVSRGILLKLVSRSIERGGHLPEFAVLMNDILFEGVSPLEADVHLRLHKLRGL